MAAYPAKRTAHLTAAPEGGRLAAWHTTLDVAAYEMPDRSQVLAVNGKLYSPDLRTHHHPTQLVINLCHQPDRKQAEWVKALETLPPFDPDAMRRKANADNQLKHFRG